MRRISILITLALVALPAIAEEKSVRKISVFLDSAIPHFAVGGPQWQTTFIFHNPSEELEKFYLSFFGDNGLPLAVPVLGGMHSSVLITLLPHATYKLVSDYRPELSSLSGGALITDPYTCSDCRFYYSTVHTIFAMNDLQQGKFLCEATVPQESAYENNVVLVYDQKGYVMGVALMNPSASEIKKVTATVYNEGNQLLRTEQFYMDPLTHQAFGLSDRYPETAGKLGYVKFSTEGMGGIAGIGLRFSPNGTFTSMHFISAD